LAPIAARQWWWAGNDKRRFARPLELWLLLSLAVLKRAPIGVKLAAIGQTMNRIACKPLYITVYCFSP
jgi:hypothetical protein